MKNIIIIAMLLPSVAFAQSNSNQLGINMGYTVMNSKSLNLFYDWGLKNKSYLSFHTGMYCYSESRSPLTLRSSIKFGYFGIHYKPLLGATRNFAHYGLIGASIGSYQKKLQYFPAVGLQQVFYTGPSAQLFIAEEVNYLFGRPKKLLSNKWQPFLKAGIQFRLN